MKLKQWINFYLLLFILIQSALYAQTYSDSLALERRGETQKALEILYKLVETTRPENEQYFLIIDKIISLETDIFKILNTVENKILRIPNTTQRIQLLKKMATLMELSGNIENAGTYYEMIYELNNSDDNIIYLLKAAVIHLETGNIEKARSLAKLVESRAKKMIDTQKAILLTIYIDILEGNKDAGFRRMSQILDDKYTEETLFIIYKISHWYDIKNLNEKAKNILRRTHNQKIINELDIYQKPLSPAFLFTVFETEKTISAVNQKIYAYIQTGLYGSLNNAQNMQERVKKTGLPSEIMETTRSGEKYYKVVIPVETEQQIEHYNLILKDSGIESFIIFN